MTDRPDDSGGAAAGGAPDDEALALPADRPRGLGRQILSGALSYGVVVLVLWFVFQKLSNPDTVTSAFELIEPWMVVVICLLGLVNLASNLPPIVVTLPTLRYREAGVTNTASAALSNTVPEGGAVATGLNFAMLRSWGFRLEDITTSFLATGIWTNLVRYSLGALGLVVLVVYGTFEVALLWVTVIVVALVALALLLFGLILRSERFAAALGRLADRIIRPLTSRFHKLTVPVMADELPRFRLTILNRVSTCWRSLTLTMIVSQLTTAGVLVAALRMQGVDEATVGWAKAMVAYSAMAIASLIVPTPGGLGVAEAALVAVLTAGLPAGTDTAPIVAGVLLFRIATWAVPIPVGLVSYLYWRKSTAWRRPRDTRIAPA